MQEIELKFQIPAERRNALWATLQRGGVTPIRLQAHYFDTADGLLARHAVALRMRREGELWVQTLKASSRHGAARLEDNAEIEVKEGTTPTLDIDRHRGSPADERLREVLGAGATVHEVYRTEVLRHTQLLHAADGLLVELAFDEGQVIAGSATHPLCEIEFELKAGPLAGLFALVGPWVDAHGLWLDSVTKAERGFLLARGRAHGEPVKPRAPLDTTGMETWAAARERMTRCLAQVLPNASAVAAGSAEDEHRLQLQAGLREIVAIDGAWVAPLKELINGSAPASQVQSARVQHALLAALAFAMAADFA